MRIGSFATFLPNAFISSVLKGIKVNIDEEGKNQIIEHGLYHVTKNEQTATKILESNYLKPSTGLMKNIKSYGTACVCLFNGAPTMENYIKNMANGNIKLNPILTPNMVADAIKIMPTDVEELKNYKTRLADNVVIYEGFCELPKEKVKSVKLVPDLERDLETGKPIVDKKTNEYKIVFREANENELNEDKTSYNAKEDYLAFIEEKRKQLGYLKGKNLLCNMYNIINNILYEADLEGKLVKDNKTNIFKALKRKIEQIRTPKLGMPKGEKIDDIDQEKVKHSKRVDFVNSVRVNEENLQKRENVEEKNIQNINQIERE